MAEDPINEEELDGSIINLSKPEFDILWKNTLKQYGKLWEAIKKRYPIGVCVQGEYSYSYPQGDDFIAIYKGDEPFCLNQLVRYKVKSYDDINMWLVVG